MDFSHPRTDNVSNNYIGQTILLDLMFFRKKSDVKLVIWDIFQLLASKDPGLVNKMNNSGETALHQACLNRMPQNVEMLLQLGADPTLSKSKRYPIHCAMKADSLK